MTCNKFTPPVDSSDHDIEKDDRLVPDLLKMLVTLVAIIIAAAIVGVIFAMFFKMATPPKDPELAGAKAGQSRPVQ